MTSTAPQMTPYAHARAILADANATEDELRSALAEAAAGLRLSVERGVPKVVAARLLGISRQTLDKWIKADRVRTVTTGRKTLVDADDLADLIIEVERIRKLGENKGVLSIALHHLAQRDERVQRQVEAMLEQGLAAMQRGDLVTATVPDSFGEGD